MTPPFAEPPTPQRFFRRPASSRSPSSSSGTPEIVVTALPRRPATSRRTFARPPARGAAGLAAGLRPRSPPPPPGAGRPAWRRACAADRRRRSTTRGPRRPPCPTRYRCATSADADQVDDEHERLVGADHPAGPALAVGEVRRDRDAAPAADAHPGHALVPAADHLALAQPELERVGAVPRRVELPPRLPRHADVVDLDDVARRRLL